MTIRWFVVCIALTLSSCATTAPAPPPPALPDTRLGAIAAEWLAAVNSGSPEAVERFVNEHYTARALRDQSAGDRIRAMRKLQLQSGGVDLVEVTPAKGELPMSMLVRSRRANRYARVIMGIDAAEGKLVGSGIEISDAPAAERAKRWPAGALSDRQIADAIRKEIDRRTSEGTFSGVVLVARDDRILVREARGFADREAGIPNRLDTKFHLASVGKMFTAASIAQLVGEGKLSYDAKVIDLLPDYPNRDAASKITVRHLLTHRSGLGTYFGSPGFVPGRRYASSFDEIAVFKDEPLFFEPGDRWRYSNAGYVVLAAIIERLSGDSYLDYLRERIFEPLGMRDTYTDIENASVLYRQSDDDPLGLEPFVADRGPRSGVPNGFGGGYSTAEDLFRFARVYRHVLGFVERTVDGTEVRGHSGGGRADVEMVDDYTVVILTNAAPPPANAFGNEIVEFLIGARGSGLGWPSPEREFSLIAVAQALAGVLGGDLLAVVVQDHLA